MEDSKKQFTIKDLKKIFDTVCRIYRTDNCTINDLAEYMLDTYGMKKLDLIFYIDEHKDLFDTSVADGKLFINSIFISPFDNPATDSYKEMKEFGFEKKIKLLSSICMKNKFMLDVEGDFYIPEFKDYGVVYFFTSVEENKSSDPCSDLYEPYCNSRAKLEELDRIGLVDIKYYTRFPLYKNIIFYRVNRVDYDIFLKENGWKYTNGLIMG